MKLGKLKHIFFCFQRLQHWGQHQHVKVELDQDHHVHAVLYDPELSPGTGRRLGTRRSRSGERHGRNSGRGNHSLLAELWS